MEKANSKSATQRAAPAPGAQRSVLREDAHSHTPVDAGVAHRADPAPRGPNPAAHRVLICGGRRRVVNARLLVEQVHIWQARGKLVALRKGTSRSCFTGRGIGGAGPVACRG